MNIASLHGMSFFQAGQLPNVVEGVKHYSFDCISTEVFLQFQSEV